MFSRIFIERPRFAMVISLVLSLAGIISVFSLPIALYPEITPPEVSQTTVSSVATENTRRATTTQTHAQSSSRTQTGSAAPATYGTNAASARETLAHLSPERQKAVRRLAAEGGRAPQLQKLSQDVAFVENSLGMKKADFDQAMKKHTWQTDAKKMKDFADSVFLCRDKPTSMEFATRRLLTDAGLSTGATRAESEQIAKRAGRAIEQRTPNTLSRDLAALGTQVSAAETLKQLPRS